MKRKQRFLAAALLVAASAGCKGKEAEGPSVATVNGKGIPIEQFSQTYGQFLRESGVRFNSENEAKTRVLETMVDRELMVQEAIALGIDRQADVAKQIETEIRMAERKIKEEYLIQNYLRSKMGGNPNAFRPTEADVSAFYQIYHALPFTNPNAPAWKGPDGQANLAARYILWDDAKKRAKSYVEAHDTIAQHLGIQKQQGMLQSVLRTLKEKAKIEVDNATLASVRMQQQGVPGMGGMPGGPQGRPGGPGAPAGANAMSAENPPQLPVEVGSGPERMKMMQTAQAIQRPGGPQAGGAAPPPGSMPPPRPK